MNTRQLHLFDSAKPLLERFGEDFFRGIPPRPGIYIMTGDTEKILYIGQSKNLRTRLASYKNARPDRAPRKVIRLVHCVKSIVWEECADAATAQLRENELLRLHRPRFNRMNTFPQAYAFIGLRATEIGFTLNLTRGVSDQAEYFGAFKGGYKNAFAMLLRLLWMTEHQTGCPATIPARLTNSLPRDGYEIPCSNGLSHHGRETWFGWLRDYLDGVSPQILDEIRFCLSAHENSSVFDQHYLESTIEALTQFYERNTKRNRTLRLKHGIETSMIPQEHLDDLLIK